MLRSTIQLIDKLQNDKRSLKKECRKLKQQLAYANTKIFDLREAKRVRDKALNGPIV
jgi:hypothetical protein